MEATYTYLEFMEHIKICDACTLLILIDLLREEANGYTLIELKNLYANLHYAVTKFKIYHIIIFKI